MTPRQRIAHVCADRGIDITGTKGAAAHLRSLATALATQADITVHVARSPALDTAHLPFRIAQFRSDDELAAALAAQAPTVVYERYSLGATGGLRAARALGVPFVLEVNAPLVAEATAYRPDTVTDDARTAEAHLLAEADLVITVSGPLRDHVLAHRSGRPTVVVPNGCDPALFQHSAVRRAEPTIGFLGHPKPWHGADRLVDILESVRGAGIDARLLIVGGGDGADGVAAAAAERGLSNEVEITGAVDQATASALIGTAWVGLAPYEPNDFFYFCPLKIIEYMAAGIPVVASDLGDIPDLLDTAGVVVDAGNDDAFVDAVVAFINDGNRAQRLGEAGRARALGSFTWSDAAAITLDAIHEVLAGRGAAT